MNILIAEDDYISRKFMVKFLSQYGDCDVTVDGLEAIEVFMMSLDEGKHYDLICLDIMMPEVDGLKALKTIRKLELERQVPLENRAKIVMTTALNATDKVFYAFDSGSEGFAVKPIDTEKFLIILKNFGFDLSAKFEN